MRLVLAPNAFKESLTAAEAAHAMRRGFARALPGATLIAFPIADGGDGTAEVLRRALGGRRRSVSVTGPLGARVGAELVFIASSKTAVIEMAQSSGLALVPPAERDPMRATSRGLGELMRAAIERGAQRIILGVGGSATVEGGAGAAEALGFRFLDSSGKPIAPGGAGLLRLARIVPPEGWREGRLLGRPIPEIVIMCDVTNRLLGAKGAAAVFGPQKGATPASISKLERGLANLARCIRRDLGRDVTKLKGGGAAGGVPAGFRGFFGARLVPGADFVLDLLGFNQALAGADFLVTGEGRLDLQTLANKAPAAAARAAKKAGVPTIALAGEVAADLRANFGRARRLGVLAAFGLPSGPLSLSECKACAGPLLRDLSEQIGFLLRAGAGPRRARR